MWRFMHDNDYRSHAVTLALHVQKWVQHANLGYLNVIRENSTLRFKTQQFSTFGQTKQLVRFLIDLTQEKAQQFAIKTASNKRDPLFCTFSQAPKILIPVLIKTLFGE